MLLNYIKSSSSPLIKTDYILIKKSSHFKSPTNFLQIFSLDSAPSLLHPLAFLDIVYGSRPKLIPQWGGQLHLRNNKFYYYFYFFYLELLPRQNFLPSNQINFKQHTEFDNFQNFYAYFYAQKSFYFQYQFVKNK
jgi:hypothetical protein